MWPLKWCVGALGAFCFYTQSIAVPAFSNWQHAKDVHGIAFEFRLQGDEYFSWAETRAGEVLAWNQEKQYYEYAALSDDGGRLQLSGKPFVAEPNFILRLIDRFFSADKTSSDTMTRTQAIELYRSARKRGFESEHTDQ